jgi:hypothetical protein
MDKTETAATGEGKAPRRSKDNIKLATNHDVITRAWRYDAAHCALKVALKDYAKKQKLPWHNIVVDAFDITLVDTERNVRLTWRTPRPQAVFLHAFDEGKVIDDNGIIHTAEDLCFSLKLDDAEVKPMLKREPRKKSSEESGEQAMESSTVQPSKPTKTAGPRKPRTKIAPSHHRFAGFRGGNRIAAKMLVR